MRVCGRCGCRTPFAYCASCRAVRVDKQRQRRECQRIARQMATRRCACQATPDLFGVYSKCATCVAHDQAEMRARCARDAKARRVADAIERQLAQAEARRKRQRLTLTDQDCWAGWRPSLTGAGL